MYLPGVSIRNTGSKKGFRTDIQAASDTARKAMPLWMRQSFDFQGHRETPISATVLAFNATVCCWMLLEEWWSGRSKPPYGQLQLWWKNSISPVQDCNRHQTSDVPCALFAVSRREHGQHSLVSTVCRQQTDGGRKNAGWLICLLDFGVFLENSFTANAL